MLILRGSDSQGAGHWQAPRGSRSHNGIDVACCEGAEVYSPVVDFLNQLQKGAKEWSFMAFAIHLVSAAFFGWMCGNVASEVGYESGVVAVAGGIGGFLGVRVADLLTYRIKNG